MWHLFKEAYGAQIAVCMMVLTLVVAGITGCTTKAVLSRPLTTKSLGNNQHIASEEGTPYFLPKGRIKLELQSNKTETGEHKDLTIGIKTDLVPDTYTPFVLESVVSSHASKSHHFAVTNSLLTTISTRDDSKVDEIIADLTKTALNIVTLASAGFPLGGGREAISELEAFNFNTYNTTPTPDEIKEVLNSISPGQHHFLIEENVVQQTIKIPGTSGRLHIIIETSHASETGNLLSLQNTDKPTKPYRGIYTRTLVSKPLKITVAMDATKLAEHRIRLLHGLNKMDQRQLISNWITQRHVQEGDYVVASASDHVMVPDTSLTFRIPVRKSRIGQSTNTIKLQSGVLVEYNTAHPSSALEFVKIPLNITDSLLALPTNILQFKIDLSEKNKELKNKQNELEKGQARLEEQVKSMLDSPTTESQATGTQ